MRQRFENRVPENEPTKQQVAEAVESPKPPDGSLPAPYARIVRKIFDLDPEKAFSAVTEGLSTHLSGLDWSRVEYAEVVQLLDEASGLQLIAHQLAADSAVTVARFESDLEVLRSDMRAQALASIQQERQDAGGKAKTITEADVESRMAASFPDEYRRQQDLLAKAKASASFIRALPEQWSARRRELDGIVRSIRKG